MYETSIQYTRIQRNHNITNVPKTQLSTGEERLHKKAAMAL